MKFCSLNQNDSFRYNFNDVDNSIVIMAQALYYGSFVEVMEIIFLYETNCIGVSIVKLQRNPIFIESDPFLDHEFN